MVIRVGVIGQSGEIPDEVARQAEEVGYGLGQRRCIVLTGGTTGVMEAASRGAKRAGGLVVGLLPGDKPGICNAYVDIPITTGLSFDYRSVMLIRSSDVVVMIGGGNGTLGELSMAYLNTVPAVVLEPSGGWAERLRDAIFDGHYMDHRKTTRIEYRATATEVVDLAVELATSRAIRNLESSPPERRGMADADLHLRP